MVDRVLKVNECAYENSGKNIGVATKLQMVTPTSVIITCPKLPA